MSHEIITKFTRDEVKQRIYNLFKKEHADLLTDCIMGMSEYGGLDLAPIFKASLGIEPVINYFVGDEVLVPVESLSYWRWDKDKMIEQKIITKEEYIKGKIFEINKWRDVPYKIEYEYIHKDSGEIESNYDFVSSNKMELYDELPNVNKKLKNLSIKKV